jgi:hypothetical protein
MYTPLGDKTVQMYIDMLNVNSVFAGLSAAQMLQYANFGQQECANISKRNGLRFYMSTKSMATVIAPIVDITDGDQTLIGSNGYVSAIDLTTYDINSIIGIHVGTLTAGKVITTSDSLETLAGYINDTLCPDVAYCWTGDTLNVFAKTSVYTYAVTTLVDFWHYRNAENLLLTSTVVDIPSEMEQLALLLILRRMYIDNNISLPQNITSQIRTQCTNLNITYPI